MLLIHRCVRCDHDWASRLPKPPIRCARCKATNWDRAKIERPQVGYDPRLPRGKKRLYPIDKLEVGQSMTLLWNLARDGYPDPVKNHNMNRCVLQEEKRFGKKFLREPQVRGLKIVRIA